MYMFTTILWTAPLLNVLLVIQLGGSIVTSHRVGDHLAPINVAARQNLSGSSELKTVAVHQRGSSLKALQKVNTDREQQAAYQSQALVAAHSDGFIGLKTVAVHKRDSSPEALQRVKTDREQQATRQNQALVVAHSVQKCSAKCKEIVGVANQKQVMKPRRNKKNKIMVRLAVTAAKLVVWGVGLALAVAFSPAVLLVAGGQALLGFMISVAALKEKAPLGQTIVQFSRSITSSDWCALFLEVGQNMLAGWLGGTKAVGEVLMLSADVADLAVSESTGSSGVFDQFCHHMTPEPALQEYRKHLARDVQVVHAQLLMLNVDIDKRECDCRSCDSESLTWLKTDTPCIPFYTKCDACQSNQEQLLACLDPYDTLPDGKNPQPSVEKKETKKIPQKIKAPKWNSEGWLSRPTVVERYSNGGVRKMTTHM